MTSMTANGRRRSGWVSSTRRRGAVRAATIASMALALLLLQGMAVGLAAQDGSTPGGFRAYLHVFLAFGAAWMVIGTWVFQIGRRLRKVSEQLERAGD